ncbi:restriction endonuclease subunit S [Schinkia azotoformans]|uniref:restriction endonuclease subunit S n=1 Tax=Schinkia azotoformans TaxID=1454 RepID=UPI002DBD9AFC|nr:restriction endonuclease subunit S [Schinkia azotoformans]MEC1723109.1 restriction endonuclease subunit S [Schinkia azotoformans]MED4414651.1 restriction endonuclease subunit S [Schinkia azotoformans]
MELVNLNKLCEINIGKTPSRANEKYWGEGKKWISISDMKSKYIFETKEEITDLGIKETNMKIVPENTVLMSFKLSIGKLSITKEDMYTNEAIASFPIIKKDKLIPEFLFYALKTLRFDGLSDRAVMGATLNKAKLNQLKIPLPPLRIQEDIVGLLEKADGLINKRKVQIKELNQLAKSVFLEMFGDPVTNPKGWDVCSFRDVTTVRQGLQIPIAKRLKYEIENSYKYITVQYLNGHKEEEYIQNPKPNVICTKDDILMTRTGNTGMVISNVEGVFHNNFFLIDFNRNLLGKLFLIYYLNTEFIQWDLLRRAGNSTIPDLNHSEFYKISVYVPPLNLQNLFAEKVEQIERQKELLQSGLSQLENMYNALIQMIFKGKLFSK